MRSHVTSALLSVARLSERRHGKTSERLEGFYTIMLFVLVMAALLVVLLFGTTIYGWVNDVRVVADDTRAGLNVISNSIRQVDSPDAVYSAKGPQGDALILVERTDNGDYETRFYSYDGSILQEYSRAGLGFNPEGAVRLVQSSEFGFDYKNGLVTVYTDMGSANVALRSEWRGSRA